MNTPHTTALDPASDINGLLVGRAGLADWQIVQRWAAEEGWNPADGDAAIFRTVDRGGLVTGRIGHQVVSAISVVNYDDYYAHLGHFLVEPTRRGVGIGRATWDAALPHAEDRTIGLDAAPSLIDFYVGQGFKDAWRTLRYEGPLPQRDAVDPKAIEMTERHMQQMAEMDIAGFHAARPAFALGFAVATGRTTLVHADAADRIAGYGVLRRAHDAMRIGPLYARTPETAAALFDALCERAGWAEASSVCIDVPEFNSAASEIAESRGLSRTFETTRMYRHGDHGPRPIDQNLVYALSSLELG